MSKKKRYRTVSRMVIGGRPLEPGTTITADPSDPVVRAWLKAGNVVPVKKRKVK